MPQRSCPDVPLESVITYRHVPRWWQLVIRRGQVFFRWYNETSEMPVDAQYLEMRWLKSSEGCWKVVPEPTRMAYLFYDLAFFTLPERGRIGLTVVSQPMATSGIGLTSSWWRLHSTCD